MRGAEVEREGTERRGGRELRPGTGGMTGESRSQGGTTTPGTRGGTIKIIKVIRSH